MDLVEIRPHAAHAALAHHAPGVAHHGAVRRHFFQHDGTRAHLAAAPHGKGPQHLRARAHDHVVLEGGVALAGVLARAAQRHALIERHVVADDGGLADDHAVAVVDEQPVADDRAGMDLDARPAHGALADHARQQLKVVRPQPMRPAVPPHGLVAGVTEHDLPGAARGGVAPEHRVNVHPPPRKIGNLGHSSSHPHAPQTIKNASLRCFVRKEALLGRGSTLFFTGRQKPCPPMT